MSDAYDNMRSAMAIQAEALDRVEDELDDIVLDSEIKAISFKAFNGAPGGIAVVLEVNQMILPAYNDLCKRLTMADFTPDLEGHWHTPAYKLEINNDRYYRIMVFGGILNGEDRT